MVKLKCYQILGKIKPLKRAFCGSLDKACDFSIEKLSYKLSERDWQISDIQCLFKNFFKGLSQHKLSTKKLDSESCNFFEI